MAIYERFGVRPIINVAGVMTRYGAAIIRQEALEAMNEAAKESVPLIELQAAASKIIAEKTHAEAGLVTAGASAALTMGTAACIAGFDVAIMNRLPDTTGIPNEVILPCHEQSGIDIAGFAHAISLAGAKIINVDTDSPHHRGYITKYDIEAAITQRTVAIVQDVREGAHPSLEDVIATGNKYNIPVMFDAAAQVPPAGNLYKFIDMGADLVAISGGKGIRGPQTSGILCGRYDLVASAALQMLDMSGPGFAEWNPPATLIPKEKLRGKPKHGIGRGMKVSKEIMIGLLVALQLMTEEESEKDKELLRHLLLDIAERLKGINGVELEMSEHYGGGNPTLKVIMNESVLGRSVTEVSQELRDGDPSIYVWDLDEGMIVIHSANLNKVISETVAERLYAALTG